MKCPKGAMEIEIYPKPTIPPTVQKVEQVWL